MHNFEIRRKLQINRIKYFVNLFTCCFNFKEPTTDSWKQTVTKENQMRNRKNETRTDRTNKMNIVFGINIAKPVGISGSII